MNAAYFVHNYKPAASLGWHEQKKLNLLKTCK